MLSVVGSSSSNVVCDAQGLCILINSPNFGNKALTDNLRSLDSYILPRRKRQVNELKAEQKKTEDLIKRLKLNQIRGQNGAGQRMMFAENSVVCDSEGSCMLKDSLPTA